MYYLRLLALVATIPVVLTGCNSRCHKLVNNVCRTIKREPKCFDYCDRSVVYERMACSYWAKYMRSTNASSHFQAGFLEGYSDYLHRGGKGMAPPIPPRRYWEPTTNMGRQNAVREWKSGFQTGAEAARESGQRELLVVPYDGPPVGGQDGHLWLTEATSETSTSLAEETPKVDESQFYNYFGEDSDAMANEAVLVVGDAAPEADAAVELPAPEPGPHPLGAAMAPLGEQSIETVDDATAQSFAPHVIRIGYDAEDE